MHVYPTDIEVIPFKVFLIKKTTTHTNYVDLCRDIKITAVDIDPAMLTIATDYFGLVQDDQLEIIIEDGIQYLNKSAKKGKATCSSRSINNPFLHSQFSSLLLGKAFKAVLFDVDSKDPSVGMSCPPIQFLKQEVLEAVKQCIKDKGI